MTPEEHYEKAEHWLQAADNLGGTIAAEQQKNMLMFAQAHATLSLRMPDGT